MTKKATLLSCLLDALKAPRHCLDTKETVALFKRVSEERGIETASLETRINRKIQDLAVALIKLQLPRKRLPEWVREDFSEDELLWFATAMAAFCDEGI